ncbi:MAG TPA: hypothetical protein VG795_14670, partial [Acidimicrobiia bacterium]|nr:hypothetical protein [Acidimicrobiia bacterium]
MSLRYRRGVAGAAAAMLLALLAVAPHPARAVSARSITDPTGDTKDPDTKQAVPDSRSDIVEAAAEYRLDGIVLRVKTADPRNPVNDASWDPVGSTVNWALSTNGDLNNPSWHVQYGLDEERNALYVEVYEGNAENPTCTGDARFTSDRAYEAVIDPNC